MSKPSTPVRRSKVGPGRPGSADFLGMVSGGKPRTPGTGPPILGRARSSTEGRRSAAGTHGVIPLTSTTAKAGGGGGTFGHPSLLQPEAHQPSHAAAQRVGQSRPGTALSEASSRFNPMTEVGRVGGVFFTDLRRSFADGAQPGEGVNESQELGPGFSEVAVYALEGEARASRLGLASIASQFNPMQSPSSSVNGDDEDDAAFAEYAGEEARGVGAGREGGTVPPELLIPDTPGASSAALTDFANPMMTPSESRAATPLPAASTRPVTADAAAGAAASVSASTASQALLTVIRDLYATVEPPPSAGPSRPATALSEAGPAQPSPPAEDAERDAREADGEGAEGGEVGLTAEEAAEAELAASRAAVAALAVRSDDAQAARRSELGEYMTALQDLKDDSGGRLIELPADWGVMLERLFRQARSEYATLEGWMGPRRFEDLPISQLPPGHPDPRVAEGLLRVRELDAVLNDKLIAALISHRETFPEQASGRRRGVWGREARPHQAEPGFVAVGSV
ncbi:hypothetical protein GPECTOR_105g108 [Gonium pectorale]|uniref:Uncharacterized protein n=1 Tax=Gonium pectorale TaxID=33097 RepID=A0A150FZN4_GONPE|nr:hypothetical protein GPECTOR_105g108 [Gonium pectorale]|eukprot:KXZ43054.1 hypothetical protein GPECTOR_105g108 [Gonium pectorale]